MNSGKISIFLSSRSEAELSGLDKKMKLADLRTWLKQELEKEEFLGESFIDVITNETGYNGNGDQTQNSFDKCLKEMRSCNLIVLLYNGGAGWNPGAIGICHAEFQIAMQTFPGMTVGIDLQHYFPDKTKTISAIDKAFREEVKAYMLTKPPMSSNSAEQLKKTILKHIKEFLKSVTLRSFAAYKEIDSANPTSKSSLNWSQRTYSERQSVMSSVLQESIANAALFPETIVRAWTIPDNMSVADARNLIGRPFLHEQDELNSSTKEKAGVIHVIAVYGNATEMQVKSLVGYPDIAVIKGSFGFYLWEKTSHIQLIFLTKCINPAALNTAITRFNSWLSSSGERNGILNRAQRRYRILQAIKKEMA